MNILRLFLLSLLAVAGMGAAEPVVAPEVAKAPASAIKLLEVDALRDPQLIALLESLPVQEAGRIKPLLKLASTRLLAFRARQSVWLTDSGEMSGKPLVDPGLAKPIVNEKGKPVKLGAVSWLLLSWLRPDVARLVPLYKVDNSAAITELGLKAKQKRDQYSHAELEPAREMLMQKRREYEEIAVKQRTAEQRILVQLSGSYLDYEMILGHLDFARAPLGQNPEQLPADIKQPVRLSRDLPRLADLVQQAGAPMQLPWFRDLARGALGAMMSGHAEAQLRLFPPQDAKNEVWDGPGSLIFSALQGQSKPDAAQLKWLALYEELGRPGLDAAGLKASVQKLVDAVNAAAEARAEAQQVPLELHLIHADYFFKAQWAFLLGLILVALTWVSPGSALERWSHRGAWLLTGYATVMCVVGVVVRCLIMQRPPITTLYETILFIGASCALFGLLAQWLAGRGLGLLLAAFSGAACMFLSIQFDTAEATDNLQQLQAVLITNFWLSTHVPIINLGYAACMVAALVSMVYWIKHLVGRLSVGSEEARFFTRVAYAFVGAGLLLSLVGTVLGGIWANYSWGRFWGWDPKDNGALMIVLMCVAILHARLGGHLREAGIHICNLLLGCIVIFSWFGVNQLGVGLHAYGFTDGTWPKIYAFWGSQGLLMAYGLWQARKARRLKAQAA